MARKVGSVSLTTHIGLEREIVCVKQVFHELLCFWLQIEPANSLNDYQINNQLSVTNQSMSLKMICLNPPGRSFKGFF